MTFICENRPVDTQRLMPKIRIQGTNNADFLYYLIYYLKNLFSHRNKFITAKFKQYFTILSLFVLKRDAAAKIFFCHSRHRFALKIMYNHSLRRKKHTKKRPQSL